MSVLLEQLAKEGSIPLERYGHQVGGHHLLFKFKDTLCKPVFSREHFFYQTAPKVLRRHMPGYYGVINVSYIRQPSGSIQVVASPKMVQPIPIPPSVSEPTSTHACRPPGATPLAPGDQLASISPSLQPMNGMEQVIGPSGRGVPKCTTGYTIHSNGTSIRSRKIVNENYKNPWATMCSHNMDERLKELGRDLGNLTRDYMVLENLTTKYHSPSVLDLKLGTRQHGDNVPQAKVQKHTYTCSISTSRTLGVRMAGMQKFNASKNEYVFYDKYFGKQLTVEEFSQLMYFFFNNGVRFRSDLLRPLVRVLEDLQASIKALPTYRYFSSSLLIIYDGAVCPEGLGRVEVGLNDSHFDSIILRAKTAEENEEYIARNFRIEGDASKQTHMNSDLKGHLPPPPPPPSSAPPPSTSEEKPMTSFMSDEDLLGIHSDVDVRMIDFAHATHSEFKDPISYEGLDEGYLMGMDSLIEIFTKLIRTHCVNGRGL